MVAKLTAKQKIDIIEAYLNLTPMIELAKQYGLSRQSVYKVIKAAGVDTSKNGGIEVSCSYCQKVIKRQRNHVRKTKHLFCDHDCYYTFLRHGNGLGSYVESRMGVRIARSVISQYFDMKPSHIPHHKDRNQFNNDPQNLMVFRCQGDHIRHHRGFEVEPLWDGADLPPESLSKPLPRSILNRIKYMNIK